MHKPRRFHHPRFAEVCRRKSGSQLLGVKSKLTAACSPRRGLLLPLRVSETRSFAAIRSEFGGLGRVLLPKGLLEGCARRDLRHAKPRRSSCHRGLLQPPSPPRHCDHPGSCTARAAAAACCRSQTAALVRGCPDVKGTQRGERNKAVTGRSLSHSLPSPSRAGLEGMWGLGRAPQSWLGAHWGLQHPCHALPADQSQLQGLPGVFLQDPLQNQWPKSATCMLAVSKKNKQQNPEHTDTTPSCCGSCTSAESSEQASKLNFQSWKPFG